VSDGIEELARQMLKAAYRRRQSMFGVSDVISPRGDQEVVSELGYDDHTAHRLWVAEQWLEDRRYITAVPMHGRGGPSPYGDFYTITPAGMAFMDMEG
jgi:hypothetical protein